MAGSVPDDWTPPSILDGGEPANRTAADGSPIGLLAFSSGVVVLIGASVVAFPPRRDGLIGGNPAVITHPATAWTGDGRLDRPARRIVSLLPSATEIVCALGLADRLVAVTHECDFPADALAGLPRITADRLPPEVRRSGEIDAAVRSAMADGHGIYDLDDAMLAELEPDLVLTQELCRVCAVAYPTVLTGGRARRAARMGRWSSRSSRTRSPMCWPPSATWRVSPASRTRGAQLVAELERRLAAVGRAPRRRRIALVEWLDPLFAPGHWVPEQVERAGGASVIGRAGERSARDDLGGAGAADPELVVLGLCGFDLPRTLEEWGAFEPPSRIAPARVRGGTASCGRSTDRPIVSRPGPRLVDGVEILAAILAGTPDPRAHRLDRLGVTRVRSRAGRSRSGARTRAPCPPSRR